MAISDNNAPVEVIYSEPMVIDQEHPYIRLNLEATLAAMKTLKFNGFKMWIYLAKNQRNLKNWTMYCSEFTDKTGLSANTFRSARKELIESGYLTSPNGSIKDNKTLEFHEMSQGQFILDSKGDITPVKTNNEELEVPDRMTASAQDIAKWVSQF